MTGQPMPDPPRLPPIEPRVCGALAATDNPKVRCRADARLYACGWRCHTHRPQTQKGRAP